MADIPEVEAEGLIEEEVPVQMVEARSVTGLT